MEKDHEVSLRGVDGETFQVGYPIWQLNSGNGTSKKEAGEKTDELLANNNKTLRVEIYMSYGRWTMVFNNPDREVVLYYLDKAFYILSGVSGSKLLP